MPDHTRLTFGDGKGVFVSFFKPFSPHMPPNRRRCRLLALTIHCALRAIAKEDCSNTDSDTSIDTD